MLNGTFDVKAVIGLGNPGQKYYYNRHNIGFRVVDLLAQKYGGHWQKKDIMEFADIIIGDKTLILIKPQTFMNSSGKVIPFLQKKGVKVESIVVVHDELELPFGAVKFKVGGSAKGHNGLKSIMEACGPEFGRVRCGIGRPAEREQVPDYVLENFSESTEAVDKLVDDGVAAVEALV